MELVILVYVDNVFMTGNPETLNNIKENIREEFNISDSMKARKFIGVYHEWGCDAKGTYAKTTMYQYVKNQVEGNKKYTGCGVNVQKTSGYTETTITKIDLEEPYNIYKYRSFVGRLIWYTTKVGPDTEMRQGSWRYT